MSDQPGVIGFAGLGQMGQPMAGSLSEVVAGSDTVFLSLPDGKAVEQVVQDIALVETRRATVVVDLSTIGLDAANAATAIPRISFARTPSLSGKNPVRVRLSNC